jgi:hypothetical protein
MSLKLNITESNTQILDPYQARIPIVLMTFA